MSPRLLTWADKSRFEPSCWIFWAYPSRGAVLRGLWWPECIRDSSKDGRAPICGHPLSLMGPWILLHTSGNIYSATALSRILQSSAQSQMEEWRLCLQEQKTSGWDSPTHSRIEVGVVKKWGILNFLELHCVMSLLFDCLIIITGPKVNLGSSEEKKKPCIYLLIQIQPQLNLWSK